MLFGNWKSETSCAQKALFFQNSVRVIEFLANVSQFLERCFLANGIKKCGIQQVRNNEKLTEIINHSSLATIFVFIIPPYYAHVAWYIILKSFPLSLISTILSLSFLVAPIFLDYTKSIWPSLKHIIPVICIEFNESCRVCNLAEQG